MEKEWITTAEAAKLLNISERQVRNRAVNDKLKAKREGNRWLIHGSLSEVEAVLEGNRSEPSISEETPANPEVIIAKIGAENEWLRERVEELERQLAESRQDAAESSHRHDTVVMQMTRLLEYHQQPFWRRWRKRKQLPEATIIDEEP
jgi:excisionase family DNA binding protein